jgi:hypothetical protein
VRASIRSRDFFKITSWLETGSDAGMWTSSRYRAWIESKTNWFQGEQTAADREEELLPVAASVLERKPVQAAVKAAKPSDQDPLIEIEPFDGELSGILKK